jgi:hypothetical protein
MALQDDFEAARDFRIRRCTELRNETADQELDDGFLFDRRCQVTVVCNDDRESACGLLPRNRRSHPCSRQRDRSLAASRRPSLSAPAAVHTDTSCLADPEHSGEPGAGPR